MELLPGPAPAPAVRAQDGYLPAWLSRPAESYWSEYWPHHRAVYFRYRVCQEMPSRPFEAYALQTLSLALENNVDSFVIDVRGNGGGDSSVFLPLVGLLVQSMDTLRAHNPRFKVFLLADGGTYSPGTFVVWQTILPAFPPEFAPLVPLGAKPVGAIYVGEPTGGKPKHYGQVSSFGLPRSGSIVFHSTRLWDLITGIPDRDAYYPEISVAVLSTDYFARHDPVLAAALTRALPPPAAPSGEVIVVNSASFRPDHGIAPGSFASAFGAFPAGARLTVNGAGAAVLAASASQIDFRVPPETAAGPASIEVGPAGAASIDGRFEVVSGGPGLFVSNLLDSSQPGAVLNQDSAPNTRGQPAARGSVVQIFGTGHGPLDGSGQAAVAVWIAGYPAELLFSGPAPGVPGLWQINARVPAEPAISGRTPLFVKAENRLSNGVTIWVQ